MIDYSRGQRWPPTGDAGLSAEVHAAGDTPRLISQEVSAGACARWRCTFLLPHGGRTGAMDMTQIIIYSRIISKFLFCMFKDYRFSCMRLTRLKSIS